MSDEAETWVLLCGLNMALDSGAHKIIAEMTPSWPIIESKSTPK